MIVRKIKHDCLELTYPGLPKCIWEIPPERVGRYIPFDELYCVSYDAGLTEKEQNNDLNKQGKLFEGTYGVEKT